LPFAPQNSDPLTPNPSPPKRGRGEQEIVTQLAPCSLSPPLRGRGGEGASWLSRFASKTQTPHAPHPSPPKRGAEGEQEISSHFGSYSRGPPSRQVQPKLIFGYALIISRHGSGTGTPPIQNRSLPSSKRPATRNPQAVPADCVECLASLLFRSRGVVFACHEAVRRVVATMNVVPGNSGAFRTKGARRRSREHTAETRRRNCIAARQTSSHDQRMVLSNV